jgi:predicted HAD superfamily hydrolase
MNPATRFNIDNFQDVLREIEQLGRLDYLRDLEDAVIKEIVNLIEQDTAAARQDLIRLEKNVEKELQFTPRNHLLIAALRKSIKGALSAAKVCLM